MSQGDPVLMAVDDDSESLRRLERELGHRYGEDYRIVCAPSIETAQAELERMRAGGEALVLVLADAWIDDQPSSELLGRVRALHPHAKRALLIDWGAWGHRPTADLILQAMATGRIDYYVLKPTRQRDEQFHRIVAEFVHEWSREHSGEAFELTVVGRAGLPRTHEIRDLLSRSGIPHGFHAPDSPKGRALIGERDALRPVVCMHDGRILVDPSNEEIVEAFGVGTGPSGDPAFDLVVVGAGPAGLSAAVYAASEGLRTVVLEREAIGGQAGSSSLIRNYLGFSRGVSGSELSQRAYQQAWVFGAEFAVSREARTLDLGQSPYGVTCDAGYTATGGAVLLATGVSYRRIGIEALEELTGAGVYYGASTVEAQGLAGEEVYVIGGGNSAGQAALHLARTAARVTLLVRGTSLAESMSNYLQRTIEATPNVAVSLEVEVVGGGGEGWLEWLELRDSRGGDPRRVAAAAVFVLIGAHPRTGWLPDAIALDPFGQVLTGPDVPAGAADPWPLERAPMTYETSVPGVFAVGDVRAGAIKRVASAVGEGSVVISDVHDWLDRDLAPGVRGAA